MEEAKALNPRWINKEPAWDIQLTNGETRKGVTKTDIAIACRRAHRLGLCGLYSTYVDVVRNIHIRIYNNYHTRNSNDQ